MMKSRKNKGRAHNTTVKKRWSGGNPSAGDIEVILSDNTRFTIAHNDRAQVSKTKKLVQLLLEKEIPMVFSSSGCSPCNDLADATSKAGNNKPFVILKYHGVKRDKEHTQGIDFFNKNIGTEIEKGVPFLTTNGITGISWENSDPNVKLTQLNQLAPKTRPTKDFIEQIHKQSSPVRKLVTKFKDQGPSSITGKELTKSIQGLRANIKGLRDEYNEVLNKSPTTETNKFNALNSGFQAYYARLTKFCNENPGVKDCTELRKRADQFKADLDNRTNIVYENKRVARDVDKTNEVNRKITKEQNDAYAKEL